MLGRGMLMLLPLLLLGFSAPKEKAAKLFWDEVSNLDWNYFKTVAADEDTRAAQSNIGISTSCSYNLNGATVYIRGSFNRGNSWVKNDCKNDYILNHEQRHYDIAELFARKFRKALAESSCNYKSFNAKFNALYTKYVAEHNQFQDLYDEETKHSINGDMQTAWNNRIDNELAALENYALPEVKLVF